MPFDYQIKRQRRKTMALHVLSDASVEVRVPKWLAKKEIIRFVDERSAWVLEQQQKKLNLLRQKPSYQQGQQHSYIGRRYPLLISRAARHSLQFDETQLSISVRSPDDQEQVKKTLDNWYRQQAKQLFAERLAHFFPQLAISKAYPELKLRAMKRRWGSCSSRGSITLNVELIKYPMACIDYVVVHELCHMIEMNHSACFYRLLAAVLPDWRERELLLERLAAE